MTKTKIIFVGVLLIFNQPAQAFEDWWQCSSKQGGEWNFARSPSVCLVNHMQDQSFVRKQYDDILFDDSVERTQERVRYMTELNALAIEVANYYLQRRKPSASSEEVAAFSHGLLALMHQETFWSHYRVGTDEMVRYMRGDVGHGHGIMQVDDRSHQAALLESRGADLIFNMIYGLDVFFEAWEKAPRQFCVNGATNFTSRTRSAWSAYNGGPGSICRWTNPSSAHASKDKSFFDKWNNKSWLNYIDDIKHFSRLDVQCLAEGSRPCAPLDNSTPIDNPTEGELYKTIGGQYCLVKNQELQCVNLLDDVNCLQLREEHIFEFAQPLSQTGEESLDKILLDRHGLCLLSTEGLIPVTATLLLHKNINLRKTPDGELITTLQSGTEFKSLDFRVTSTSDQKRYYKIKSGSNEGYIYAGNEVDHRQWTTESEVVVPDPIVATQGSFIRIVAPAGINMRQTPGGTLVARVPNAQVLEVLAVKIAGEQNYLYYEVTFAGKRGFIYSGFLNDLASIPVWTSLADDSEDWLQLVEAVPFRFLRQCAANTCAFQQSAIRSPAIQGPVDLVRVVATSGEWNLVESRDQSKKGWILSSELEKGSSE